MKQRLWVALLWVIATTDSFLPHTISRSVLKLRHRTTWGPTIRSNGVTANSKALPHEKSIPKPLSPSLGDALEALLCELQLIAKGENASGTGSSRPLVLRRLQANLQKSVADGNRDMTAAPTGSVRLEVQGVQMQLSDEYCGSGGGGSSNSFPLACNPLDWIRRHSVPTDALLFPRIYYRTPVPPSQLQSNQGRAVQAATTTPFGGDFLDMAALGAADVVSGAGPISAGDWLHMVGYVCPPGARYFGGERFDHIKNCQDDGDDGTLAGGHDPWADNGVLGDMESASMYEPVEYLEYDGGSAFDGSIGGIIGDARHIDIGDLTGEFGDGEGCDAWKCFGGHHFVLPLLEVISKHPALTDRYEAEIRDSAHASGDTGVTVAVNLVWREEDSFSEVCAAAAELLGRVIERERRMMSKTNEVQSAPAGSDKPNPKKRAAEGRWVPSVSSVRETVSHDEWKTAVETALIGIEDGDFEKVVLARATELTVSLNADKVEGMGDAVDMPGPGPYEVAETLHASSTSSSLAIELCAQLRRDFGYLFCFELDANKSKKSSLASDEVAFKNESAEAKCPRPVAFLGCTPERLFEVTPSGAVSTMAVAGTRSRCLPKASLNLVEGTESSANCKDTVSDWQAYVDACLAEDERLGAELMSSQKDLAENRVVADFIEERLRGLQQVLFAVGLMNELKFAFKGDADAENIDDGGVVDFSTAPEYEKDIGILSGGQVGASWSIENSKFDEKFEDMMDFDQLPEDESIMKVTTSEPELLRLQEVQHIIRHISTTLPQLDISSSSDSLKSGSPMISPRHGLNSVGAANDNDYNDSDDDDDDDDYNNRPVLFSSSQPRGASLAVLRALQPTPAVCGRSQEAALAAIRRLEGPWLERGWYAGPLGVISADGSAEFCVAIRSALVTTESMLEGIGTCRSGGRSSEETVQNASTSSIEAKIRVYAGAGIVQGSSAEAEWVETEAKMRPFINKMDFRTVDASRDDGKAQDLASVKKVQAESELQEGRSSTLLHSLSSTNRSRLTSNTITSIRGGFTTPPPSAGSDATIASPPPLASERRRQKPVRRASVDQEAGAESALIDPLQTWNPSNAPNVNALWAEILVEELDRLGVGLVVVAPGSRSTPIAAALAKHQHRCRLAHRHMEEQLEASSSSSSMVHSCGLRTIVHHDERGAAFVAVGFARAFADHATRRETKNRLCGHGNLAAVLTTSGTAVANLLPAVVEAAQSNLPLLLLTADRAPEARGNGANQAITQPNIFGGYVRHARDLPCPTTELPATFLLEEIDRAVAAARGGESHLDDSNAVTGGRHAVPQPVHLNLMFRENLAPDRGAIRGDWRSTSVSPFHGADDLVSSTVNDWDRACVKTGRFQRWLSSAVPLSRLPLSTPLTSSVESLFKISTEVIPTGTVMSLFTALGRAHRGVIVAGAIAGQGRANRATSAIARLAEALKWPIIADVQSGLRYGTLDADSTDLNPEASSVLPASIVAEKWLVPCHDAVISHSMITSSADLHPDFILQFGAPLVSAQLLNWFARAANAVDNTGQHDSKSPFFEHVVVGGGFSGGYDPAGSVSYHIGGGNEAITAVAEGILQKLEEATQEAEHSDFVPGGNGMLWLRSVGRAALEAIENTIGSSIGTFTEEQLLTEPWIARTVTELMSSQDDSLFVSASMPVRDMDAYCFFPALPAGGSGIVAANRGASGIDGILSSALGFAVGRGRPTTVLLGDQATLHDLSALHVIAQCAREARTESASTGDATACAVPPLTIVVVNNGGGAIFSFLPVAKFGDDVQFKRFFAASHDLSIAPVASALGLKATSVTTRAEFKEAYLEAKKSGTSPSKVYCSETSSEPASPQVSVIEAVIPATAASEATVQERRVIGGAADRAISKMLLDSLPLAWRRRWAPPSPTTSTPCEAIASPVVVLLHGFMGAKDDWVPFEDALLAEWSSSVDAVPCSPLEIISIDLPLHGSSLPRRDHASLPESSDDDTGLLALMGSLPFAAESLIRLLEELGAPLAQKEDNPKRHRPVTVVGYSMGGRVALEIAHRHQHGDRIKSNLASLVLVGAHPGLESSDDRRDRRVRDDHLAERLRRCSEGHCSKRNVAKETDSVRSTARKRFREHLVQWYSSPLWGNGFLDDEGEGKNGIEDWADSSTPCASFSKLYHPLIDRRCKSNQDPALLAIVAEASSLGRQRNNWPMLEQIAATGNTWNGCKLSSCSCAGPEVLFVHGTEDEKFSALGNRMKSLGGRVSVLDIEGAAHAVLEQVPFELAKVVGQHLRQGAAFSAAENISEAHPRPRSARLSLIFEGWSLPLRDPIQLSEGSLLTERRGFHVYVRIKLGDEENTESGEYDLEKDIVRFMDATAGVGEVCPLPGFHTEDLYDVQKQLAFLSAVDWQATVPLPSRLLGVLNSSGRGNDDIPDLAGRWLEDLYGGLFNAHRDRSQGLPSSLFPSVKSGLEQAMLHALGWFAPSSLVSSPVVANSLVLRSNGNDNAETRGDPRKTWRGAVRESQWVRSSTAHRVVKVKVGGTSIEEDVERVIAFAAVKDSPDNDEIRLELRLDANQAWTLQDAIQFWQLLPESVRAVVTYIEEPLTCSKKLGGKRDYSSTKNDDLGTSKSKFLEQLARLRIETAGPDGKGWMPVALDESLTAGVFDEFVGGGDSRSSKATRDSEEAYSFDPLVERSGIVALVLKPSLLGPSETLRLAHLARHRYPQLQVVLSATFDGDVGLAHHALLASILAKRPKRLEDQNADDIPNAGSTQHGLGTYRHFDYEASDFHRRAVINDATGFISTIDCISILDKKIDNSLRQWHSHQ